MFKNDLFFDKTFYPSQFESLDEEIENNEIKFEIKTIPLKECIMCCNRLRKSIFYPCGHRCACYICAEIEFTINKKCPRCGKKAICLIKKLYE